MQLLHSFWKEEAGFLIAGELILISTILVLGMVVGLTCVRNAVTHELEDVAYAFSSVNQSYRYSNLDAGRGGWGGSQRDPGNGQWDVACSGY